MFPLFDRAVAVAVAHCNRKLWFLGADVVAHCLGKCRLTGEDVVALA